MQKYAKKTWICKYKQKYGLSMHKICKTKYAKISNTKGKICRSQYFAYFAYICTPHLGCPRVRPRGAHHLAGTRVQAVTLSASVPRSTAKCMFKGIYSGYYNMHEYMRTYLWLTRAPRIVPASGRRVAGEHIKIIFKYDPRSWWGKVRLEDFFARKRTSSPAIENACTKSALHIYAL